MLIKFKLQILTIVVAVGLNYGLSAEQLYLASPFPSFRYPPIDTKKILLSLPPLQVSPLRVKARPSESTLFFIKKNEKKEDEYIPVGVNVNENAEPLKFILRRVTVPRVVDERTFFNDISNDMKNTINNFKDNSKDNSVIYSKTKFDTNSLEIPYVKNTPLVFGPKAADRSFDFTSEQNFGRISQHNLRFNSAPFKPSRPSSAQSFGITSPQLPIRPLSNKETYYKSQQLTFGSFSDMSKTEELIKAKIDAFFANTDTTPRMNWFNQKFETKDRIAETKPNPTTTTTTTTPKPTTITTEASTASSKLSDTATVNGDVDALESKQTLKEEIASIKRASIRGSYSYVDSNGINRIVNYIADENGFRSNIDAKDNGSFNADSASLILSAQKTIDSVLSDFSSRNNVTKTT